MMSAVKRRRSLTVSDLASTLLAIRRIDIALIPSYSPLLHPLNDIIELCNDVLNAPPDQDYSGDSVILEVLDDNEDR